MKKISLREVYSSFFPNPNKLLLIMKLTIIMSCILTVNVYASVYSQNTKLDLEVNNETVRHVLKSIEERSEFRFFYNDDYIDLDKNVSLKAEDATIDKILTLLLDDTSVRYRIMDNNFIVLTPQSEMQQQEVRGTITDGMTGQPIVGVTVQVKGTMTGDISQADGGYNVNVTQGSNMLIFSFVGYQTQEIEINGRTVIDVVMQEQITALEEVVVTGYSVEKKKDIIGSVSVVDTDEMISTPSANLTSQLGGRVAGLTVSSSGDVDGTSKVRIRGFGSFSGSEPLYIIDGVPGSVDNLNPNDIESLQVLKDAASASVYGARAANGVVIITTKQGTEGPIKVDIDYYYGINYVSNADFPDLLNVEEMGELYWKQMEGAGREYGDEDWYHPQYGSGPEPVIPEYILANVNGSRTPGAELEAMRISDPALFDFYVNPANYDLATHQIVKAGNTDWFDETFNPAPVQNLQLTFSGGSSNGTYAIGMNYYDRRNTADKYSYFKRYSLRVNSALKVNDVITVGENVQILYNDGRNVGLPSAAWEFSSLLPVHDIMGGPTGGAVPMILSRGGSNPIAGPWRNRFDGYDTYGIFGNIFADLTLLDNLVLHTSFGLDYNNRSSRDLTQVTYEQAENVPPPNYLTWSSNNRSAWTFTSTLTYSKTFGSHNVKVLLGTESNRNFMSNLSGTRGDILIEDDENYLVLDSGSGSQSTSGTKSINSLFSLFARLDYSYAEKYIINATIRRDGSSKFGINNRYGYFPAVAVGYRISSEPFMENLTWLTDLKLRASYGIIGNQTAIPNENQYSTFQQTIAWSYPIQGFNNQIVQSYIQDRIGNPDARWEQSVTTNIGFDLSLFSGSFLMALDIFKRETKDLLVTEQAPTTGPDITQPMINAGNIENKGVDFSLTQRGRIAGVLDYEVTGNFSAYKNTVTKVLDNPLAILYGGDINFDYVNITRTGEPISMFYGYKIDGFFNSQDEVNAYSANGYVNTWLPPAVGRWKIVDVNDDKIINDQDRTYIGSPHPDFQVGMNVSLGYKNFDFNAFLFWNQGGDIYNAARNKVDFNTYQFNRSARMLYDSWTPENTDALLPKHDINDTYSATYTTDYFVEDATYIRLRQLQLGYTIPSNLTSKLRINNARIYVQAENLWTWARNFSGMDPGVSISGASDLNMGIYNGETPTPKQILFGINLSF